MECARLSFSHALSRQSQPRRWPSIRRKSPFWKRKCVPTNRPPYRLPTRRKLLQNSCCKPRIASAGGARLAQLRSPICYETLRRLRSFLLMTDHPMFLEYDWTSNTYRSHLCGASTSVAHSFETLAASRHALHLIGLRIGDKTDERTWRIEFIEPVAERADFSRLGGWAK